MGRHQMATHLRNRRTFLVLLMLCLATNARWAAAQAGLGFPQNDILVSEVGVAASSLIQSGRVYAEISGPVNTGWPSPTQIVSQPPSPFISSFTTTPTSSLVEARPSPQMDKWRNSLMNLHSMVPLGWSFMEPSPSVLQFRLL